MFLLFGSVFSSEDNREVVAHCLSLGAIDYWIKPLRSNEIRNLWTRVWWSRGGAERAAKIEDGLEDSGFLGASSSDRSDDVATDLITNSAVEGLKSAPDEVDLHPKIRRSKRIRKEKRWSMSSSAEHDDSYIDSKIIKSSEAKNGCTIINDSSSAALREGDTKKHHHHHYHHHYYHHHRSANKEAADIASGTPVDKKRIKYGLRSHGASNNNDCSTSLEPGIRDNPLIGKIDKANGKEMPQYKNEKSGVEALSKKSEAMACIPSRKSARPGGAKEMQEVAEALTSLARGKDRRQNSESDLGVSRSDKKNPSSIPSAGLQSRSVPDSTETHLRGSFDSQHEMQETIGNVPMQDSKNGKNFVRNHLMQTYSMPQGPSNIMQPPGIAKSSIMQMFQAPLHVNYFNAPGLPFLHHMPYGWGTFTDMSGNDKFGKKAEAMSASRENQACNEEKDAMHASNHDSNEKNKNPNNSANGSMSPDMPDAYQTLMNQYQQFQQFQRYQQTANVQNVAAMMNMMTSGVPPPPGPWGSMPYRSPSPSWVFDHQPQIATATGATSHLPRISNSLASVGPSVLSSMASEDREILRQQAVQKYRQKRKARDSGVSATNKIRYKSRKILADARPRVRGQFVKSIKSGDTEATSKVKPAEESVNIIETHGALESFIPQRVESQLDHVMRQETHASIEEPAEKRKSEELDMNVVISMDDRNRSREGIPSEHLKSVSNKFESMKTGRSDSGSNSPVGEM